MCRSIVRSVAIFAFVAAIGRAQSCPAPANCLLFTSTEQDHVRIPDPGGALLDGFANFTIEFWLKTSTNGIDTLVSKWRQGIASETPYMIRMWLGKIQVYFTNGYATIGTVSVNDGLWHHVAVTRTGSAGKIVVDGVLDTPFTYAPLLSAMNGPVVFGCFFDPGDVPSPGTFYDGRLDEVRIWNVGHTVAQIQSTMNQTIAGAAPNLVGCWRLDASSGQGVFDSSASVAHGFLGSTNTAATNDPSWSVGTGAALMQPCAQNGGNPNSALATLLVNGVGTAPATGPFPVGVAAGGTLTFNWAGPAGMPVALLSGTYNPANTTVQNLGIVDIGIPPAFADIIFIFDGTLGGASALFFTLGPGGTATQSFTLPPSVPAGPFLAIQGIVFQPAGSTPYGIVLTAAFRLNG